MPFKGDLLRKLIFIAHKLWDGHKRHLTGCQRTQDQETQAEPDAFSKSNSETFEFQDLSITCQCLLQDQDRSSLFVSTRAIMAQSCFG